MKKKENKLISDILYLLQGESVYEKCSYITTNADLAEQISATEAFSVVTVNENYIIKPN